MKAEELKGKTGDELGKALLELKKQQFNLRVQKSQGQLENTAQIRTVRRGIARVKTFMGQLAGDGGAVAAKTAPKAEAKKKPDAKKAPEKKAEAKKAPAKKAAAKKKAGGKDAKE